MKAYTTAFKARLLQRLVGPRASSANRLAREVGVSQVTLSRWLALDGRRSLGWPPVPGGGFRVAAGDKQRTVTATRSALPDSATCGVLRLA